MQRIAKLISLLLHPLFSFPVLLFLPFLKEERTQEFLPIFFLVFGVPFLLYLFLLSTKRISDWDIKNRKERYPLFFCTILCLLISLILLSRNDSELIFQEYLFFFLCGAIIIIFNFWTKVSIHVGLLMMIGIFCFRYFQNAAPFLFALVPLVATSRLFLKKHTLQEVTLGIVIPLLFYSIISSLDWKVFF